MDSHPAPSNEKSAPPPKKRRAHYKSRKGCKECKQRHVKCDELRPVCLQCSTLGRSCSYALTVPGLPVPDGTSPQTSSTSSPPGSNLAASNLIFPANLEHPVTQEIPPQVFDLGHLALLHHVETDLLRPPYMHFVADEKDAGSMRRLIIQSALSVPFLMDEILAFAALHLSVLDSDMMKKNLHRDQAVQLQTRALMLFNACATDITEQNCTAIFLFSSFIGMHMLYDTVNQQGNLLELIEKFIQFVGLYRGVGVITNRSWHIIRNSELSSIINIIEAVDMSNASSETSCARLLGLLELAKERLGPSTYQACYDAVEILQGVFIQHAALPEPINRHIVLAWPVRISVGFLNLLKRRHPEALAIMAHWGILLHYGRDFWVFSQGGRYLIEAISTFLGSSWDEWLAWPIQTLAIQHNRE